MTKTGASSASATRVTKVTESPVPQLILVIALDAHLKLTVTMVSARVNRATVGLELVLSGVTM